MKNAFVLLALVCASLASVAHGFYLPGVSPRAYKMGEPVELKVNKLDSVKTQLPYDYYSLPFCKPTQVLQKTENLGEVLSGDRIENSIYAIFMRRSISCRVLCKMKYKEEDLKHFATKIDEEYRVNWIIDNLPSATKYYIETEETKTEGDAKTPVTKSSYTAHYDKGFALGFVGSPEMPGSIPGVKYLHNHVVLRIFYHEDKAAFEGYRIVAFEVDPVSIDHEDATDMNSNPPLKTCVSANEVGSSASGSVRGKYLAVSGPSAKGGLMVTFTYDVVWQASDIKWASRWDLYLKMTDTEIHWFSIINSIMIVLFLSSMVGMIMMRALHRDFSRYNDVDDEEQQQEDTGWKLIHGDVFRPPAHGAFFSVLVGTGVQVFSMCLITLVFAVLGFLSPANRGGLMTAFLLLFVFMGVFAGYSATRTYKMFGMTEWKTNCMWTALLFPGVVFTIFFILNLFVWGEKSSGAVPFGTLIALLVLWFGISVPLVYIGSYLAFKKPAIEPPVKVTAVPRIIVPSTEWYNTPLLSVLLGGLLPFGAVFIEIFFIMSSVWQHQFYYVFGFLFLVFIILIITCAMLTIVLIYFQLCSEDYHWWWRSYFASGSTAIYLFLYSIVYFNTKLQITNFVSGLLFFGYMSLVSLAFFMLTGTIGYFAAYYFVRKIYSSIKVD